MVLGILSLVLFCTHIIAIIMGITGGIMGIVSLVQKRDGKGLAIAGIITSAIGIMLGVLMFIGIIVDYGAY